MAFAELMIPCLSVFAVSAATVPVDGQIAEAVAEESSMRAVSTEAGSGDQASPIVLAQASESDALNAGQLAQTESEAEMEAPYSAEIQPPTVEVIESDVLQPVPDSLVFADKTDDEIFAMAAQYLQSVETMSAYFIQTAPSGNVSTGKVQISRPGRLRFEYDSPNPLLIVATQGLVYVHDSELETTDSYPVGRTPLKFLLDSNVKTEGAVLREVLRGEDSVNIVLESTDEETEGELILAFDAPELKLRRWAVVDPNGDYTVVDLDGIETGVRIANNTFRIPEAGSSFLRDR